jgi:putative methanogenesis marker protein 6
MSEERETRLLMISPKSGLTPDQLSRRIHAMGKSVTVKETCYGCLVEGPRATVREIRDAIREDFPDEVFSKVRAYPAGDPRRCRAQHGTRPGYAQLEMEWEFLSKVQHGLECIERGEDRADVPVHTKLPVNVFKKICEANR